MSKALRFFLAAILLIAVLLLARSELASAVNGPDQRSGAAVPAQSDFALADAKGRPGSVKPPPVVVPPINDPGTYSAGGLCTVIVQSIAEPMSLHVNLLPFSTLHNRPQETERYLAGVCLLTYVKRGAGVTTDIVPADAVVKVCFAAIPNSTNKIYVYDDKTWYALDTTTENGLACATAMKTGKYVLVKMP
jgi:hypothetical protein